MAKIWDDEIDYYKEQKESKVYGAHVDSFLMVFLRKFFLIYSTYFKRAVLAINMLL